MFRTIERRVRLNGDDEVLKLDHLTQYLAADFMNERGAKLTERGYTPYNITQSHREYRHPRGYSVTIHLEPATLSPALITETLGEAPQPALPLYPQVTPTTPAQSVIPTSPASRQRTVPDGTYTVVRGDQRRTFRVFTCGEGSKLAGKRVIKYLSGANNENDYVGFGFVDGSRIVLWKRFNDSAGSILLSFANYLVSDWRAAGETYALESGRCYRCGRTLTVPASIHRGLGPDCAEALGL